MTDNTSNELSLLKNVPHVLRARGYRLYLSNGKRLVDLWLNGGAAVLGHTPANLLRELKNAASRGLYAPLPHFTENRLFNALSKLLPERCFRIYAAPPQELLSLFKNGTACLWKPFIDSANPFADNDSPLLIPVLPGIQTWRDGLPLGLCITAAKSDKDFSAFPQSDMFSPVQLAAATRGIYDLLAAKDRTKLAFPRINKALQQSRWEKQGIYLKLKEEIKTEKWQDLFNQFLESGFLLPPSPSFPLILPGELSDGEEVKLATVLQSI